MMKENIQKKLPVAYILRLTFALIGVLFILLFMVRGIYQLVFTILNCSGDINALIMNSGSKGEHWHQITEALKQSPGGWFDTLLYTFSGLILLHGGLGIYYAIITKYSRFKENALFYLQILSAIAAGVVIMAIMSPSSGRSLIISILIAVLGSFHIGKGLYNACITLGISVSRRTKVAIKALSWVAAVISLLQIVILFI